MFQIMNSVCLTFRSCRSCLWGGTAGGSRIRCLRVPHTRRPHGAASSSRLRAPREPVSLPRGGSSSSRPPPRASSVVGSAPAGLHWRCVTRHAPFLFTAPYLEVKVLMGLSTRFAYSFRILSSSLAISLSFSL